jgi:energy-coupling factor transport system ATP-binding protein
MEVRCTRVSFQYEIPGEDWAVRELDLAINQGEKILIAGPAGSGKTTLLQLLDALIMPVEGDILYDGVSIRTIAKNKGLTLLRRRIGMLFQFPEEQFFQEKAYDELAFAMRNFLKPGENEIRKRAYEVSRGFGLDLEGLEKTSPFHLSSGEKRKLALASTLMLSPEILLLDEPTAGLDAASRRELIRIIDSLKDTTVLMVTHNQEDFLGIVDRIIGISDGRLVLDLNKDLLLEYIGTFEDLGILPPLVLQVQHWLAQEGIVFDRIMYDMEDMIAVLKDKISK